MSEYPDNVPVCWWTPSGYQAGGLPTPFDRVCREDGLSMQGVGYEQIACGSGSPLNYEVECWKHLGEDQHLLITLADCNQTLGFMCVAWEHSAAFFFDKWADLVRNQRTIDEPSLNKAIIAFIRHGHDVTTIDRYGVEDYEARRARLDRQAEQRAEREKAKRVAAGSSAT